MPDPALDSELQKAMREYLTATNRLAIAEERNDDEKMFQARREQRAAAEAYHQSLIKRGWRAPVRNDVLV
jgi:hypothetical protein